MATKADYSFSLVPIYWETGKPMTPSMVEGFKIFYSRVPFYANGDQPFLFGKEIDRLLGEAADIPTAKWAVVFGIGTVFGSQFQIVKEIQNFLDELETEVLVCGHLMNRKGFYCGLHEQCFLVNLEVYNRLGRPSFGEYITKELTLADYEAGPSIHDDYTPQFIKPTGSQSVHKTKICGWGLINASLANGMPVPNLSMGIRRAKSYLYPDDENDVLNHNLNLLHQLEYLSNPTQRKVLGHMLLKKLNLVPLPGGAFSFEERSNCLFLFNTEFLFPELSIPVVPKEHGPLDVYSGPCSGFQDIAYLALYGFHDQTRLVYFDVNQKALMVKERILRDFNGDLDTLPQVIEDIKCDFSDEEIYVGDYQLKIDEMLIPFHGDKEKFRETWSRLRLLPRQFIHLNLLGDNSVLFSKFKKHEKIVLNVTDIFLAQNELVYGYEGMQSKFKQFHERCCTFENLIFVGRSVNQNRFIQRAREMEIDTI